MQTWVMEINNKTFNIIEELITEEAMAINPACEKLNSLWQEVNFMQPIEEEYDEYIQSIEDEKGALNKLLRQINNYLSAYKAFLDRWETYLKRNKDGSFFQLFHTEVKEIYDRCFEYRFLYNLRNYSQHNGHPVSNISKSLHGEAKVILNKDEFFTNHKGMQGKFKRELESISENNLDVDKAIRVVHRELLELHSKLINKTLNSLDDEYWKASVTVLKFYKKYNKNKGIIALTESETIESFRKMSEESSNETISYSRIPKSLAETIVKGVYIKFKFKGKLVGKSNGIPSRNQLTKLAVEMPKFEAGSKYVEHGGIMWVRVLENTGQAWRDGYDRYFALYMPEGLTTKEYNEKAESFKDEINALFNKREIY